MKLPARTEGPHCWLWLLLYREAGRDLPGSADGVALTQAAGLLWERIVDGSLSIKRDRSGLSEEEDPWLSELVAAEARRHVALSSELERKVVAGADQLAAKSNRPIEERLRAIGLFIWRQLGNGSARVADREEAVLFWDPVTSAFLPYSLELNGRCAQHYGGAATSRG